MGCGRASGPGPVPELDSFVVLCYLSGVLEALKQAFSGQDLILLGATAPAYAVGGLPAFERFTKWLGDGKHADMAWLEQYPDVRANPEKVLPGTRTVLLFALPYFHELDETKPMAARYAQFADYHKLLKVRAEAAMVEWRAGYTEPFEYRITVDTAPVLERALAATSSQTFVGKNTCLIHEEHGSFLLLGEIFLTAEVPLTTSPEYDSTKRQDGKGCGPCTSCQTVCPTGALDEDYRIDAAKCLAYWTIEHRGTIPLEYWPWLKDYWYGCDLCQTACPYNGRATAARLPASIPLRTMPPLDRVAMMSQGEYEQFFGGTPMTRAKRAGLQRNALIALAVTKDPALPRVMAAILDVSPDPVLVETLAQVRDYCRRETPTP